MRRGYLQDFSHFGKQDDTLEDLACQYEELEKYKRCFIKSRSRFNGFDGRRLEVVSREFRDLLVENTELDLLLNKHAGANNEYVMLSGRWYSVRMDNIAYRGLLREYKQLEAVAEEVFSADISLKDSIENIQGQTARTLRNEQLINFRYNCCIGVTFLGIASAVLVKMFG